MAGRIDQDKALAMFQRGISDADIGRHFGTSRQGAYWMRQQLIKQGKLAGDTKPSKSRHDGNGHKDKARTVAIKESIPATEVDLEPVSLAWEPTQSALYQMMLQSRVAQKLAQKVHELTEENKRLKAENARIHEATRHKYQWELAQQQGEIKGNFTEHIVICLYNFRYKVKLLSDIILNSFSLDACTLHNKSYMRGY